MPSVTRVAGAALLLALLARPAAARVHGSLGAGGAWFVSDGEVGFWGGAELWPGGRWGGRLDAFHADGVTFLEASLAYQLGTARPHLDISLHAGAGASLEDPRLVVAAGLATRLGLGIGPLALGLDLTAHAASAGGDTDAPFRIVITSVLGVHAAF